MKKCPFCAEEIQDEAVKCRFCKEMLPASATSPAPMAGKKVESGNQENVIGPLSPGVRVGGKMLIGGIFCSVTGFGAVIGVPVAILGLIILLISWFIESRWPPKGG